MAAPAWTVIVSKSFAEDVAEHALRQAGFRCHVFRYRKLLLPHGRQRAPALSMRPLFERLVFVQDWRGWPRGSDGQVTAITGVASVMQRHHKGPPATLSDADIALMIRREMDGRFDEVLHPPGNGGIVRTDLEIGSTVEFEAFGTRIMGELEELSADGKALVRVVLFGRETPTEVDALVLHAVSV